ncbi:hypothetical protein D3C78_1813460 [compost metagenome]
MHHRFVVFHLNADLALADQLAVASLYTNFQLKTSLYIVALAVVERLVQSHGVVALFIQRHRKHGRAADTSFGKQCLAIA